MANANINVAPPQPRVPLNDPPGVLPLFDFVMMVMRKVMTADTHGQISGLRRADAVGFESTGPIVMQHWCDTYKQIMQDESMGYGQNAPPDATPHDKRMLHILWCNHVVPKALQHAHMHMKHRLETDPTNPEWINRDGHHNVVKVFLALLDMSLASALATPGLRAQVNMDSDIEVHWNHYERVFGRRAEPLMVFTMRMVPTSDTNA